MALSANNHKMHSLMRQLKIDDPVFPCADLDRHIDAIVAQAARKVAAGPRLRQQILQRSRALAGEVAQGWQSVRSFVAHPQGGAAPPPAAT